MPRRSPRRASPASACAARRCRWRRNESLELPWCVVFGAATVLSVSRKASRGCRAFARHDGMARMRLGHENLFVLRAMTPRGALILLGGGLIGLTLAALALHIPGADTVGTVDRKHVFVALLAVAAVLYLLAVALVLRRPTASGSMLVVLGVAVAMRLIVLFPQPFLSSDMYRYVWDGRVQVAGINPYHYFPADPALQSLRDEAIYPHINRAEVARTIYPPFAQLVFHAVALIS